MTAPVTNLQFGEILIEFKVTRVPDSETYISIEFITDCLLHDPHKGNDPRRFLEILSAALHEAREDDPDDF